jgi:hypothetical protein
VRRGAKHKMKRRQWTRKETAAFRKAYPGTDTKILAARLKRTVCSLYGWATKCGVTKSAAYQARKKAVEAERLRRSGVAFRYSRGHVPANAGLRCPGYAPGRMAETQFKKGRPPSEARNYKAIGSYRVNADGYLERKLSDTGLPQKRWQPVHRLLWAAANGPIPEGHAVVFKSGRSTTALKKITLDAIELLSREQLMLRNSYHTNYPIEIRRVIQLRGAVQRQINRRVNKQGERPSKIR